MTKLLALFAALAAFVATPALAQDTFKIGERISDGNPQPAKVMCWSGSTYVACGSDTTAANQASQITQETAINTKLAAVTRSTAVSSATPGSALAIDTRNIIVKGQFGANVTTAYAAFADIGGLVTIATGLPAGTVLEACRFQVKALNSHVTTSGTLFLYLFDANPTASTYTDNVASSLALADIAKAVHFVSVAAVGGSAGQEVTWTVAGAACPLIAVDASGNLYAAALPNAAFQLSNAAALYWSFEARY